MLGALAEPHERHVGTFAGRDGRNRGDVDLARDHLVAERREDGDEELESLGPLICDQDAEVVDPVHRCLPVTERPARTGAERRGLPASVLASPIVARVTSSARARCSHPQPARAPSRRLLESVTGGRTRG